MAGKYEVFKFSVASNLLTTFEVTPVSGASGYILYPDMRNNPSTSVGPQANLDFEFEYQSEGKYTVVVTAIDEYSSVIDRNGKDINVTPSNISNTNGGDYLVAGKVNTINLNNINAKDVVFINLEKGEKKWSLPVSEVLTNNSVAVHVPEDLVSETYTETIDGNEVTFPADITITVFESKSSRDLRTFIDSEKFVFDNVVKTTNFTADIERGYLVDTSSSSVTMLLPPNPKFGDKVKFVDFKATFSVNAFNIDPNGKNIYGSTTAYVASSNNEAGELTYLGEEQGWKFTSLVPSI